jgi:glycosyltransferase involved in cell wall biosynthesis
MRILHANKYNFIKGGADKYFLDLCDCLEKQGIETVKFCMSHPSNLPDEYSDYFAEQAEYNNAKLSAYPKLGSRMIWNREAARKFEKLIKATKPDLVHIHNIYHQLSPSIVKAAKKHGLPVVMHLHDYKYLCPNYKMYNRWGICERCQGGHYLNCLYHRCVKNSPAMSALVALEMYIHHSLLKIYERNVDLFIAPTEFVAQKFCEWGGDPGRVKVLNYFIKTEEFTPEFKPGDYFLFFGRLSEEKGILTLVKAVKILAEQGLAIKLKIVGAGPEEEKAKRMINGLNLSGQIELTGPKYGEELKNIVKNSRAVIVPSEWYEVSGIVIMEAGCLGKPVIVSRIGGIPENIMENLTGLLYSPGKAEELADKMTYLLNHPEMAESLGRAGWEFANKRFNVKNHLDVLTKIYQDILDI